MCGGMIDFDLVKVDIGYLNVVWNVLMWMVVVIDFVIDGKMGVDFGCVDVINGGKKYSKGEFDKLCQLIMVDKFGKIVYVFDYKMCYGLLQ